MRGARWVTAAAIGVSLNACAEEGAEVARFEARDSAGVSIVENRQPRWTVGVPWTVGAPQLVLGLAGSELEDVAGALRLPAGRIIVADGGSSRVHLFSSSGDLLESVGGQGDGPGEFRTLESMGRWAPDTLWVYDFSHGRVTLISDELKVGRTMELRPAPGPGLAVGLMAVGGFVVGGAWSAPDGDVVEGITREPVAYMRYDAAGELLDTITVVAGREVEIGEEGGRLTMGAVPFGRSASHTVLDGRVVIGDQTRHEVWAFAADGPTRSVRWRGGALRVTDADVDSWITRRLETVPARERPAARSRYAESVFPSQRPAYGPLLASDSGELWVGAYSHPADDPTSWEVFRADGAWLGAASLPPGFAPLHIGEDFILGRARDSFDVQTVELRSLTR